MDAKGENRISRRQFLVGFWIVSLVGLFGQAGAALLDFFKPRVEPGGFGGEVELEAYGDEADNSFFI